MESGVSYLALTINPLFAAADHVSLPIGSGTLMWSDQTWSDLVENNATAVMNPTSQISLEEAFAQTMVLALAEFSGIPLGSFIPEYEKIRKVVFNLWESFMWVLTANDQVFCQERILEDSPVGLPGQLPDIEV